MPSLPFQDDILVNPIPAPAPAPAPATANPPAAPLADTLTTFYHRAGRSGYQAPVNAVTGLRKRGRPSKADQAAAGDDPCGLRISFAEPTPAFLEKQRLRQQKQAATKAASLERRAAAKAARATVRAEKAINKAKLAGLKNKGCKSTGKGRRTSHVPLTPEASIGDDTNWAEFSFLGGENLGTTSPQAGPSGSWETTPSAVSPLAPSPATNLPFETKSPWESVNPESGPAPNAVSSSDVYFDPEKLAYLPIAPLQEPLSFQDPSDDMLFENHLHEVPMHTGREAVPFGSTSSQVDPFPNVFDDHLNGSQFSTELGEASFDFDFGPAPGNELSCEPPTGAQSPAAAPSGAADAFVNTFQQYLEWNAGTRADPPTVLY